MDKAEKKRLKNQVRHAERKAALAALPLPVLQLKAMFDMLDVELPKKGCDRTRRLTQFWLARQGHDIERVFAWLDTQGGFCDCEVLANVEERLNEAIKANEMSP